MDIYFNMFSPLTKDGILSNLYGQSIVTEKFNKLNYLNPKFAVSMGSDGIATCGKCGKKYDLNNGGIIQNGKEGDVGLEKYLATTTGPYGYLFAGTKR